MKCVFESFSFLPDIPAGQVTQTAEMQRGSRMKRDDVESSSCGTDWFRFSSRFFLFVKREMTCTEAEVEIVFFKHFLLMNDYNVGSLMH